MTLRRKIKRVGGSLSVLIPRDFAEAMNVREGSDVRLTLVGTQVVVEPVAGQVGDDAFRRAFGAVLRRHRRGLGQLAAYDRGDWQPRRR
jgi:antitoxin component of MazEF toxin-antitoxin module